MCEDSSYEKLSLEDGLQVEEAASEYEGDENSGDSHRTIVFDLPDSLLHASNTVDDSFDAHRPEIRPSSASFSTSSSFVPVKALGRMLVNSSLSGSSDLPEHITRSQALAITSTPITQPDLNHDSSWSLLRRRSSASKSFATCTSASTWNKSDDMSFAANSTISGFDVISLCGASMRSCKHCTFLNSDKDGICGGCERALFANPCLAIDEQLAWHLKLQEDERELQRLVANEKKRKNFWSESLFYQSQTLTDEITLYLGAHVNFPGRKDHMDLTMVSPVSLAILASRFIEFFDQSDPHHSKVSVGFHFSPKVTRPMSLIQLDGLGENATISQNPYAALKAAGGPTRLVLEAVEHRSSALHRIPAVVEEADMTGGATGCDDVASYTGWLASYVTCEADDLDQTTVTTLPYSVQSLPLACFDASFLDSCSLLHRRFRGLTRLFEDFLLRDKSPEVLQAEDFLPVHKKPKLPDDALETTKSIDCAVVDAIGETVESAKSPTEIPNGLATIGSMELASLLKMTVCDDSLHTRDVNQLQAERDKELARLLETKAMVTIELGSCDQPRTEVDTDKELVLVCADNGMIDDRGMNVEKPIANDCACNDNGRNTKKDYTRV